MCTMVSVDLSVLVLVFPASVTTFLNIIFTRWWIELEYVHRQYSSGSDLTEGSIKNPTTD
jgi:hypothetical protein